MHLDSLRGVAALGVALHHSFLCVGRVPHLELLVRVSGPVSVLFFFVLSGYVLGRSLHQAPAAGGWAYAAYFVRRCFRLYPAMVFALIMAVLAAKAMAAPMLWPANGDFPKEVIGNMRGVLVNHTYVPEFLLVTTQLIGPIWSLKVEFLCSLFLPCFQMIVRQFYRLAMPLAAFLAFMMLQQGYDSNLFGSLWELHYLFIFYLGYLISCIPADSFPTKAAANWLLFLVAMSLTWALVKDPLVTGQAMGALNLSILLGGFLILMIPCHQVWLRRLLHSGPLRFFGRISYSFYLLHWPLLFLTCHEIYQYAPAPFARLPLAVQGLLLLIVSTGLAAALAAVAERWVEQPFNRLGHRLAKQLAS